MAAPAPLQPGVSQLPAPPDPPRARTGGQGPLRLEAGPVCSCPASRVHPLELGTSSQIPSFLRLDPQHAGTLEIAYPVVGCEPKVFHSPLCIQVWLLGEKHPEESLSLWSGRKVKGYLAPFQAPRAPRAQERHPPHLGTHLSQARVCSLLQHGHCPLLLRAPGGGRALQQTPGIAVLSQAVALAGSQLVGKGCLGQRERPPVSGYPCKPAFPSSEICKNYFN